MNKDIRFKKIYQSPKEGESLNSIIAFKKEGWMMKTEKFENPENDLYTFEVKTFIAQYRYFLYIDLWLVTFRFNWLSRLKDHE